jgi:hypothetical protein
MPGGSDMMEIFALQITIDSSPIKSSALMLAGKFQRTQFITSKN